MHTRAWKRYARFQRVSPDQIRAGDILHCYAHDDQWEARAALVESVEIDRTPGAWEFKFSDGSKDLRYPYAYRVTCVTRHINLARPDATGGPPFTRKFFPWNDQGRFHKTIDELRAEYVAQRERKRHARS